MAEIFEEMKVEFIDQDVSVQVVADTIRNNGEVPERYVRPDIKADPVIIDAEGYNLPIIDMSRLLNSELSEEEIAKLGSACEDWGFFQEAQFPVVEGWPSSVEDEVISLFPNLLGRYHKYFHEIRRAMSLPSSLKGCEEIRLVAPMNVEVVPATFTERAVKEKVEGCFFPFEITENTGGHCLGF